jgi:hypothetical protein
VVDQAKQDLEQAERLAVAAVLEDLDLMLLVEVVQQVEFLEDLGLQILFQELLFSILEAEMVLLTMDHSLAQQVLLQVQVAAEEMVREIQLAVLEPTV